jgi:hypothetical protein
MQARPTVAVGSWITIGDALIDAHVFGVHQDGSLEIGYYQNRAKAIKEDVIWDGKRWQFRHTGPVGSYLTGIDEALVKRGPLR